ncbi:MAG: glucuronate isomerase [Akkermansia sp.]
MTPGRLRCCACRNPLYHWTHLELRPFGISGILFSPETADEVWEPSMLQSGGMGALDT